MTRNEIIANLFTGKNFNECLSKMEPDHLREDLKQEVILIICELPIEKIHQLYNDKVLEFYTVRVILNLIKSSTSQFHKKYRQFKKEYAESYVPDKNFKNGHELTKKEKDLFLKQNTALHYFKGDIEVEERQLREDIEDMAIEEVDKLYWYNKGLVELYMRYGNFRAIQKETGIPFGSCYKTIKKSLQQIKEKVS